jgi:hypothetical protein
MVSMQQAQRLLIAPTMAQCRVIRSLPTRLVQLHICVEPICATERCIWPVIKDFKDSVGQCARLVFHVAMLVRIMADSELLLRPRHRGIRSSVNKAGGAYVASILLTEVW